MPDPSISYVTGAAVQMARQAGLDMRRDDWRDIFLAITDVMIDDGQRCAAPVAVRYVGEIRDGERWSIVIVGRARLDVLYSPERAMVMRIVPPREAP